MKLLYEDETKILLGLIFEVRNELGGGWSEGIYHQALVKSFEKNGIQYKSKPRFPLVHHDAEVYCYEPDIIVWDKIILELKVLPRFRLNNFPSENEGQLIQYLKKCDKKLGMLINFAHSKVGIKRIAYEPPEMEIEEDYEKIQGKLTDQERQSLQKIRTTLLHLAKQFEVGYTDHVYKKLIALEFDQQGIQCKEDPELITYWNNEKIGVQQVNQLLVNNKFLILVRSTLERPTTYDYIQTRSFLEALGLKVGLIVNFGKHKFQIIGTSVTESDKRSSLSASLNKKEPENYNGNPT